MAAVLVGLACLMVALGAHADDKKRASELFTQGETRFRVGDYAGAAAAFEEANGLSPHPNILWNAARSLERAGSAARAANTYHAYLQSADDAPADRAAAAQSLARLTKQLGRLELHPEDGQSEVLVDGARVSGSVYFVTPGTHTVVMLAQGREQSQTILVDAGGTRSVTPMQRAPEGSPDPAPAAPVAAKESPSSEAGSRGVSPIIFFTGAGLTLVAAGLAVGFGVDTANERDRFDASPSRETFDLGRDKQFRTNVAVGIAAGLGVLTAVTGIWLVDWRPTGTAIRVSAGVSSIAVGRTF